MYSLVMMAALTTGGEAPNFFFHKGGCHGCYGYSSCHGCWGGGWSGGHGCWGGGCHGGWGGGGLFGHRWGCHGGSCHGCYTACSGCYGASYGCYGCYGAGYGCHGGCHGGYAPVMVPAMSHGGGAPAGGGAEPVPAPKKGAQLSAPAKLVVELPESAKLFVDEHLMKTTAAVRSFNTPTLHQGQTYYYMLRAEVVRDGKTFEETRRILVRAGETVRASFPDLERSLTVATAAPPLADATDDQEP